MSNPFTPKPDALDRLAHNRIETALIVAIVFGSTFCALVFGIPR